MRQQSISSSKKNSHSRTCWIRYGNSFGNAYKNLFLTGWRKEDDERKITWWKKDDERKITWWKISWDSERNNWQRHTNCLTGLNQSTVGDDTEFFNFRSKENTSGSQEKGINAFQRIPDVESFEVDDCRRNNLLFNLQLFSQCLNDWNVD